MRWCNLLIISVLIMSAKANSNIQSFLKIYQQCSKSDWLSCLKIKFLSNLENFRSFDYIPIVSGVSLVNEIGEDGGGEPVLSENVLEKNLPKNFQHRNEMLDSMIAEKLFSFLSKYSMKWNITSLRDELISDQGRGKGKKHLLMMPLMMAASFIPIALGTLALLAGKALIVGKMALLLVGIMGIRKLFTNSHDEDEHQRAMKRISDFGMKLKTEMMAHKMAYKNHMMQNDLTADM